MAGYINSIHTGSTVDGPGIRVCVFLQGCNLRCLYCHNPETWELKEGGSRFTSKALYEKIIRYEPFFKNGGGVTVSGGEPLLQSEFVQEFFTLCKEKGIHTALDTSGSLIPKNIDGLLEVTDLVLLDIKFTKKDEYKKNTLADMDKVLRFLEILNEKKIPTWVRHVVVPGLTGKEEDMLYLKALKEMYQCIEKIELLPFRKLCLDKYDEMGIEFPLKDTPEAEEEEINRLYQILNG